jgi:hypothetical protein
MSRPHKEPFVSLFNNLFSSGKADEKITSLNLETPKPQLPPDNSSSPIRRKIDPKLLAVAVPEINERAKKMLEAGKRPQALYLTVAGGSVVSFKTINPDRHVLLIFTSGFTAMDYLKTTKIAGGVHMFPLESLPAYLEQWRKMQLDSFVLDRCPRCPDFLCLPINVRTEEQFSTLWAVHRATRDFQSERLIRAYFDSASAVKNTGGMPSSQRERRNLLETLRDHIDYSLPYVHWLIALYAGVDGGDQEDRIAAIQNLEAFGPDFIGKVPPQEPFVLEDWTKSVAEAHLGLLATFEMLPPDLQSTVKSKEKIIN